MGPKVANISPKTSNGTDVTGDDFETPVSPKATAGLFKEADLDLLQKRARAWLERLLEDSFPVERPFMDLLADGDILHRVARGLKAAKLQGPVAAEEAFRGRNKSSTHFVYNHIDSFLKECGELGVPEDDLFSAADIIEQKNAWRVCLCFRALSKKIHQLQLPVKTVPLIDFDEVLELQKFKRMPTRKVEGILQTFTHKGQNGATAPPVERTTAAPARLQEDLTWLHRNQEEGAPSGLVDGEDCPPQPSSPHTPDQATPPPARSSSQYLRSQRRSLGSSDLPPKKGGSGLMVPILGGLVAVVGIALFALFGRKRDLYEIRKGDNLTTISRRVGRQHWEELVQLNPDIQNPDLIYPKERLKVK